MNDNDGVLLWVMQVSGEKSWKNTLGWTRRGKSGWGWPKVGTGAVHLLSQEVGQVMGTKPWEVDVGV